VDHRDSNPSGLLDLLLTLLTGPSLNILDGLLLKSDDPNNCFEVSPDEVYPYPHRCARPESCYA
jgi:hypothetical protein